MGVGSGGGVRKERPWWLRPDGMPPRAEERRRRLLAQPFTAERARRQIVVLTIAMAFQVAIPVFWTVFLWSHDSSSLVRTWLMFAVVTLIDTWLYVRARKRIREMIST